MKEFFDGEAGEIYSASKEKMLLEWNQKKDSIKLHEIFKNDDFIKIIKKLSEITYESGYESGTNVYFKENGELAILDAKKGEAFSFGSDTMLDDAREVYPNDPENIYKAKLLLMQLHFHPDADTNINPSSDDISSLIDLKYEERNDNNINDYNHVEIIMQIDNNKIIRALIIQNDYYEKEKMDQIMEFFKSDHDNAAVIKMLKNNGFNSELIESNKNGTFSGKELDKLVKYKFIGK
jgi:hypothetical protein